VAKEREIKEGFEAEKILGNEVFQKAIKNLKEEYIKHWLNSRNIDDVIMREDLHKAILLLPEIERHLRIIVEKGKITKAQIDKIKNIK
jgi:hypothetical protein